ncbi:MAG TPA: hypothetical protein VIN06_03925 [Devosia sp.]
MALLAAALAGCSSIGGIAGAVAGTATGTFSSNPAVGLAVGVSVKAGTDATMRRVFRGMQADEQARIAEVAGNLDPGARQPWKVHHLFSFGDEAGDLQVLGGIDNALTSCKEVLFSVNSGRKEAPSAEWFITPVCRQSDGHWRWAASEPATGRWGTLQ